MFLTAVAFALSACASAEVTRTSANTMIVDAGAAPACGRSGAARVATRSAAIETIRAGYDRYIIRSGQSRNNVAVTQMPGHVQTTGVARYGGGIGTINATSTCPAIVSGSHDRALSVLMFGRGDPGYEQALDAREALGPEGQS